MQVPFVSLKREANLIKKEVLKVTEEILDSGNYILGENLKNFEAQFSSYVGTKYALGVGTVQMH